MGSDRKLGLYTEVTLKKGDEYVGERNNVFYCKNCGFIELYKENIEGNKESQNRKLVRTRALFPL